MQNGITIPTHNLHLKYDFGEKYDDAEKILMLLNSKETEAEQIEEILKIRKDSLPSALFDFSKSV